MDSNTPGHLERRLILHFVESAPPTCLLNLHAPSPLKLFSAVLAGGRFRYRRISIRTDFASLCASLSKFFASTTISPNNDKSIRFRGAGLHLEHTALQTKDKFTLFGKHGPRIPVGGKEDDPDLDELGCCGPTKNKPRDKDSEDRWILRSETCKLTSS